MAITPANITTVRIGELAPEALSLTDNFAHEVGTDLFRATLQDLVNFINTHSSAMQFEIKTLNVNQAYIDTNFDSTGLGRLLCLGFAICNGNNGTTPMDGLVDVAYGTNYNVIGAFGGSKTHILTIDEMPAHNHIIDKVYNENTAGTFVGSGGGTLEAVGTQLTSTVGQGQPHNNMQPYIVVLKIMKL